MSDEQREQEIRALLVGKNAPTSIAMNYAFLLRLLDEARERLQAAEAKAQALDWLSEQTTRKVDGLWCDYSREQWVIRFNGSPVRYYSSPTLLAAIQVAQAKQEGV